MHCVFESCLAGKVLAILGEALIAWSSYLQSLNLSKTHFGENNKVFRQGLRLGDILPPILMLHMWLESRWGGRFGRALGGGARRRRNPRPPLSQVQKK